MRRKYDPGKRGEKRDDRQETQVIKETVGTEREGEGMGKREKKEVGRRWSLEGGNQMTNRNNVYDHDGRASDKCSSNANVRLKAKSNKKYSSVFNSMIGFSYQMTENSCIS